jgi:hypothetical protein
VVGILLYLVCTHMAALQSGNRGSDLAQLCRLLSDKPAAQRAHGVADYNKGMSSNSVSAVRNPSEWSHEYNCLGCQCG